MTTAMNTLYAEYNIHHNSIDIATTAGYLLRIDCRKARKGLSAEFILLLTDPPVFAILFEITESIKS